MYFLTALSLLTMRPSVGDDGDIDSENQRNINDGDD